MKRKFVFRGYIRCTRRGKEGKRLILALNLRGLCIKFFRENRERKSFVRFTVGYEIIVLFLEGERACNSIAYYKVKFSLVLLENISFPKQQSYYEKTNSWLIIR